MTMSRRSSVLIAFVVISSLPTGTAFFFGGGGGGGCACAPPPVCPQALPPPPCPVAPPVPSCLPQPGCGGSSYAGYQPSGSYIGGGNYASAPTVGGGSYASHVKQPYSAPPRASYVGADQQFGGGPQQVSPIGGAAYANGPTVNVHLVQPNQVALPQPAVQVPPASYSSVQEHAAGQRLQEVDDDLNNMIAEAKSEDDLRSESSVKAGISEHENIGLTNGTTEAKKAIDISQLTLTNNTECNSEELRRILVDNMVDDLNSSKRVIQLTAEAKFGGRFDVICSTNDFSYVTNTELYCQETKPTVSCYAYRQL